jgi:hypothetical protein
MGIYFRETYVYAYGFIRGFFANFVSDFVFDEKEKNIRNSERATWGARGRILRFTHHTPNKVIPVFTVITNTTNKKRYLPPMIR